jgi:hypothetical protein
MLFILVDQEHFFDRWPMPAPGPQWIKQNGVTFTNHQAASCVCSPARSTIYTGEHIQFTAIFDNANSLYDLQEDSEEVDNLATNPKSNGDLLMAMNAKLNGRIADEVGDDNGHLIPIRDGKWFFPPKSER